MHDHLGNRVQPDLFEEVRKTDALDELTRAYEEFIRHQPGFIAAAFHVNDAQARVASYSQWSRREDFQAMLRTPEMRERNRKISALARSFEPVLYDVVTTIEA